MRIFRRATHGFHVNPAEQEGHFELTGPGIRKGSHYDVGINDPEVIEEFHAVRPSLSQLNRTFISIEEHRHGNLLAQDMRLRYSLLGHSYRQSMKHVKLLETASISNL